MTPPNALDVFQQINWSSVPVEQVAEGVTRQMVYGDKVMVIRLELKANTVTPIHTHAHEQITVVVQGAADFFVEGTRRTANAGDVLVFPSGIQHGATMLGEDVVLIDIFSPPREDFIAQRQAHGGR